MLIAMSMAIGAKAERAVTLVLVSIAHLVSSAPFQLSQVDPISVNILANFCLYGYTEDCLDVTNEVWNLLVLPSSNS